MDGGVFNFKWNEPTDQYVGQYREKYFDSARTRSARLSANDEQAQNSQTMHTIHMPPIKPATMPPIRPPIKLPFEPLLPPTTLLAPLQ